MIQKSEKSYTTQHHADKARAMHLAITRISELNIDVIDVDYNNQQILISRPDLKLIATEFKEIKSHGTITKAKIRTVTVFWENQALAQEMKFGKA